MILIDTTGPAWDLSTEYSSPNDSQIDADLVELGRLLDQITIQNDKLIALESFAKETEEEADGSSSEAVETAQTLFGLLDSASKLLENVSVFANCLLSVDSQNSDAKLLEGRLTLLTARLQEASNPHSRFIETASIEVINEYLASVQVGSSTFQVEQARAMRHGLLTLDQENLVAALSQDGITAWGTLYDQLSASIRCEILEGNETRTVGVAEAANLMQSANDKTREDAWRAINRGWFPHRETCAAAINAIAGWRLEMCRRRSNKRDMHYLDQAVHSNHLSRATLDAIMEVAESSRPLARRAALAMARVYGKNQLGPWDQRAPAPEYEGVESRFEFSDGLDLIANAYGSAHPSMGDFVRMMNDREWIEGTLGPNKRPGAYCTSFQKSRTPRVYMTYSGSMTDITILAHELGHAFHHWTMRDLPSSQRSYGMSLAETASTFGETITRDALLQHSQTPEEQLSVAWDEMSAFTSFLLNIPTRYRFERNFYDARAKRPLLPEELDTFMSEAWTHWYGESLSETDPMFWINKLHFYISEISFYNFPYLFGYLFSQTVYLRRESMGGDFFNNYQALLMDTGRMSAEDLAKKHLDGDLTKPDFWQETVNALKSRVDNFETLCEQVVIARDSASLGM